MSNNNKPKYFIIFKSSKMTWRSRLVGRGRTIGNRVTGNTVREFESLLLRQRYRDIDFGVPVSFFLAVEGLDSTLLRACTNRVRKRA